MYVDFASYIDKFPKRTVQLLKLQITIVKNTRAQMKGDGLQSDCQRLFFF